MGGHHAHVSGLGARDVQDTDRVSVSSLRTDYWVQDDDDDTDDNDSDDYADAGGGRARSWDHNHYRGWRLWHWSSSLERCRRSRS